MDAALKLRIDIDNGLILSDMEVLDRLRSSDLVFELTSDFPKGTLPLVWRLIGLSEIPFSFHLDYTQRLISKIYEKLATPFGFSLSGDKKQFLPCYNSMIISALCRLGRANDIEVRNAVKWIVDFQPMTKNHDCQFPGFNFDRYGGCFKNSPCYIGLAKSVIALHHFHQVTDDQSCKYKLELGTEYILQHRLFRRLKNEKPITNHILDISFPESYHLNIVELIRFASDADLLSDDRTIDAVKYLFNKRNATGWSINYRYKADGYTVFDKPRESGDWITYIIDKALKKTAPNIS